jgi:DNA polymerase III epsilon subunit-like protein
MPPIILPAGWSLDLALKIVGIPERNGPHNALEDALLTAEAFSRLLGGKGLIKKFSRHRVPEFIKSFLKER